MSNKNLTAANEKQVLELIQNSAAKALWQCEAWFRGGIEAADRIIANKYKVGIKAVKAARYYW